MKEQEVLDFAKKGRGYEKVSFIGTWQGFNVYLPVFIKDPGDYGTPWLILEKDGRLEWLRDCKRVFEIGEALLPNEEDGEE